MMLVAERHRPFVDRELKYSARRFFPPYNAMIFLLLLRFWLIVSALFLIAWLQRCGGMMCGCV